MSEYSTEDVAGTVAHEFDMFEFTFRNLPDEVEVGTGHSHEEDVFLEGFLLHTRVLMSFFFDKKRDSDNVLASDFVDDWNEQPGSHLANIRKPLNKRLAHLTLERQHYREQLWDPSEIHRELDATIEDFLKRLPDDRKDWFSPLYRDT